MSGGERAKRAGRAGREVVEPLSLVFGYAARDRSGSFGPEETAAERAAAELDRRYPEGVDGLRAGYVLLRRGLVCMGIPRESGESAVAWTGFVPRRLRLRCRGVVVRRFADSIGYACLRRGTPVELGGRAVRESDALPPEQWDSLLARLPAEFAAARRYLLFPGGPPPAVAAGMRPVRERRRPSPDPVLSGVRRPRRCGTRALAVVNLLVALALVAVVTATAGGTGHGAASGSSVAGVPGEEAPGSRAPRADAPTAGAAGGEDAAVSLSALGRTLAPLSPRLRLREIRVDGGALRVRGGGGNAEAVREALAASRDFEDVVTISRRESDFVIEARYRGRTGVTATTPGASPGSRGARAAAVLGAAGAEGVAFERVDTASGGPGDWSYRISAEASADATTEALVGLIAAEPRIPVAVLSLTHVGETRWRMTAVVRGGEVAEE